MRTNYKRVSNIILKNFECEVIKSPARGVVAVLERNVTHIRIVLIEGNWNSNECGIHIRRLENSGADLEHSLVDAINTAAKDGFTCIYIHMKPKPNEKRRAHRLETLKQWLGKKSFTLNHALGKLELDAAETLNQLTEDQIDVVLAMVSGMYGAGCDETREHIKSLRATVGA